jgi:enamine deaminase RidA (YjgF/YER057c/UK114 family)
MTVHVFMSQVWAAWVDPHNKPVRACVAAPMAHPDILVEVMVTAAKLKRSEYIYRLSTPLFVDVRVIR